MFNFMGWYFFLKQNWKDSFLNGLMGSKVIVLLISVESLKDVKEAHQKPDNMLLEFETALKRYFRVAPG